MLRVLWRLHLLTPFVLLAASPLPAHAQPVADFTWSPDPAIAGQPTQFTDRTTGGPTSWAWSFGDLTTSTAQNPAKTYTMPGRYDVILTAANPQGSSQRKQTITVEVLPFEFILPIVLDALGNEGVRYRTEITLANRGGTVALLTMTYTPAQSLGGVGGGTVTETLGPLRQIVIPDGIAYLRSKGLEIPAGATSQGGTLRIVFTGVTSPDLVNAAARTTAPSGNGRAGLAYAAVRPEDALTGRSYLFGLRENTADRSNLALVNLSATDKLTLRVTLVSGGGDVQTTVQGDVILGPLQWTQLNRILTAGPFPSGYAYIDLVSGTGPYFAYAVFNDNATNDGSYVLPVTGNPSSGLQFLPVLVETETFQSELVLTNPFNEPATVALSYVESLTPTAGGGAIATENLSPFEQKIIPNALQYLRSKGVNIGHAGAGSYAGSLGVVFTRGGAASYGFVGARIAAPGDGGEYGVFERALGFLETATNEAWVFGLQQNALNRSNVAVCDAEEVGTGVTLKAEVYDGDSGLLVHTSDPFSLRPGGWVQFSSVLSALNVANGFIRFIRVSGNDAFVAYGVVNDGATPQSGATNDGSYIPGSIPSSGHPNGGSCSVLVSMSATTQSPFVGTAVVVRATVTRSGVPVPAGSSVQFTTDLGFFVENGLTTILKTTVGGVADLTVGSFNGGTAHIKAVFDCASAQINLNFGTVPDAGPFISSLSPTTGSCAGGETVTIQGGRFGTVAADVSVFVGGVRTSIKGTVTNNLLTVTTPAHSEGTVNVVVVVNGLTSPPFQFTYACIPPELKVSLSSISQTSGSPTGGETVLILGGHFGTSIGTTQVTFCGTAAQILAQTDGQITVTTPGHALANPAISETCDVSVRRDIGLVFENSATLAQAFRYRGNGTDSTCNTDPTFFIAGLVPNSGPPGGGTTVILTGGGFGSTASLMRVDFGGTPATIVSITNTTIVVSTPPRALANPDVPEAVDITVTDLGGASLRCARVVSGFAYTAVALTPTIFSVSPRTGPNDATTLVMIFGDGFQFPMQVFLTGGTPGCGAQLIEAAVSDISLRKIVFKTPVAVGANACLANQVVDIVVKNPSTGKSATCTGCFQYANPARR